MGTTPLTFSNVRPISGDPTPAPAPPTTPPASSGSDGLTFSNVRPIGGTDAPSTGDSSISASERGATENVIGGVAEGAAKTDTGILNLAGHALEHVLGKPAGSLTGTFQDNRETPSVARNIGEGAENVGEWASGLEGLEGLSKVAKFAELAEKIPGAAKTMALMDKYPFLAKMAEGVTKGVAVGGAQGAVKGAAEGKAKAGAEGGALGGAVGEGVVAPVIESAVTPLAEAIGDKFGIGTSAKSEAIRGARPGKRNYRFAQDFQNAAPYMDEANAYTPAKTIEDWADNTGMAREILYKQKIAPLVAQHATEPLGGINIANGIRKEIPDAMKEFDPQQAAIMENLANQFLPGQTFKLQMQNAEQSLQHFNAKLASTGYWSKLPAEREALLKTNGEIAGYKAAADSIRDEFYGRLNQLEPNSNVAKLKQDYGALRNVENEIRGRVNVNDRQSPINLKETLGAIMGIGTGGIGGAAIAALPFADRVINSPENMISRGVQKAARPGEEGIIAKGVQKAGKAAKGAATTLAGPTASGLGRIVFTDSQGGTHSIPDDAQALAHARTIDPGLKVIQ